MEVDGLRLIEPRQYMERGYPHAEWRELRRRAPVAFFEPRDWQSFWAITKHADITRIATDPEHFLNAPLIAIFKSGDIAPPESRLHHLLNMDPPEHREYRRVTAACPGFADAFYNLGLLWERIGAPRQARAAYERYLGLDGTSVWADRARERISGLAEHADG